MRCNPFFKSIRARASTSLDLANAGKLAFNKVVGLIQN